MCPAYTRIAEPLGVFLKQYDFLRYDILNFHFLRVNILNNSAKVAYIKGFPLLLIMLGLCIGLLGFWLALGLFA
jgi:hypothetical protein